MITVAQAVIANSSAGTSCLLTAALRDETFRLKSLSEKARRVAGAAARELQ